MHCAWLDDGLGHTRLCVGVSVVSSLCERVVGRAREGNAGTRVFGTEYTDFFLFFFNCSSDSMQLNLPTISIYPPPRHSATGQGSLPSRFPHSPCLPFSHRQHDTAPRPHRVTSTTNIQRHASIHPPNHRHNSQQYFSATHSQEKQRQERKNGGYPNICRFEKKAD
jgi:hypothetical protein